MLGVNQSQFDTHIRILSHTIHNTTTDISRGEGTIEGNHPLHPRLEPRIIHCSHYTFYLVLCRPPQVTQIMGPKHLLTPRWMLNLLPRDTTQVDPYNHRTQLWIPL